MVEEVDKRLGFQRTISEIAKRTLYTVSLVVVGLLYTPD